MASQATVISRQVLIYIRYPIRQIVIVVGFGFWLVIINNRVRFTFQDTYRLPSGLDFWPPDDQGPRPRIYTSFAPGSLGQGPTSTLYINSTCDWTQQATKRTRSDGSSGQKVKWIKIYIWIWAITRQIAATNVSPTHNP